MRAALTASLLALLVTSPVIAGTYGQSAIAYNRCVKMSDGAGYLYSVKDVKTGKEFLKGDLEAMKYKDGISPDTLFGIEEDIFALRDATSDTEARTMVFAHCMDRYAPK